MKYILGLILLFGAASHADENWEFIGPGITYHVIDNGAAPYFDHKLSGDGRLIFTPMVGLKKTHIDPTNTYNSFTIFTAANSIGSQVYGAVGGTGIRFFRILYGGFAYGAYVQNNNDFKAMGITPFSINDGVNAIVPIFGLEINAHFPIGDTLFIGFNNLLTPIITNHNLSIGLQY